MTKETATPKGRFHVPPPSFFFKDKKKETNKNACRNYKKEKVEKDS